MVLALTFLSLLWPNQATKYRRFVDARAAADYRVLLLRHKDANVRAAACELLALRRERKHAETLAAIARRDRSQRVVDACGDAAARLQTNPAASEPTGAGAPSMRACSRR